MTSRSSTPNLRLSIFLLAILLLLSTLSDRLSSAVAGEITDQCRAVQNLASITRSSKLALSTASDSTEKYCHFFVSMPPPHTAHGSIESWYVNAEKAASDQKSLVRLVTDISIASIPKDGERYLKEVTSQIDKNSDLLQLCVTALLKKAKIDLKSPDGRFRCTVPDDGEFVTIQISAGVTFLNTISLPRPA